jgi:hypothetical protein
MGGGGNLGDFKGHPLRRGGSAEPKVRSEGEASPHGILLQLKNSSVMRKFGHDSI